MGGVANLGSLLHVTTAVGDSLKNQPGSSLGAECLTLVPNILPAERVGAAGGVWPLDLALALRVITSYAVDAWLAIGKCCW